MNEPQEPAVRGGANRDGLAALAVVILAAVLIAVVINHVVSARRRAGALGDGVNSLTRDREPPTLAT